MRDFEFPPLGAIAFDRTMKPYDLYSVAQSMPEESAALAFEEYALTLAEIQALPSLKGADPAPPVSALESLLKDLGIEPQ